MTARDLIASSTVRWLSGEVNETVSGMVGCWLSYERRDGQRQGQRVRGIVMVKNECMSCQRVWLRKKQKSKRLASKKGVYVVRKDGRSG